MLPRKSRGARRKLGATIRSFGSQGGRRKTKQHRLFFPRRFTPFVRPSGLYFLSSPSAFTQFETTLSHIFHTHTNTPPCVVWYSPVAMATACTPSREAGWEGARMVTLARLQERLPGLKEDYFHRNRYVDQYRKSEYNAAVKIQSWLRGCKVRAYIRYLNKMMVFIQKWWRGYQARKIFRKMAETAYFIMKMNFYNEMAVRIQKRWRGYYVRKYIHNYYALKRYLEAIALNNEMIRKELEEFAEMKEKEEAKKALEREERKKDYLARKMHYLLSTEQIAGIYNSPYRKSPDPMELQLRKVKPLKEKKKQIPKELHWQACIDDSFGFQRVPALPPIQRQKPQGPFRDPAEVQQQRYKPFEEFLKVAASEASLKLAREKLKQEEWRNRVHDNVFLPFSGHEPDTYVPSMQRASKYGQSSYGLKHFREEHPEKWIGKKDFLTRLPSIPLFGKFGHTYSRSGQIV
uniref:Spermatosis associated 17 n=2 Tax=Anolis carolinensis TaxID=28377 RepID=G1KQG4_ANOCA|nr:PREDICTED: spermatogenesis-associated protein 17 [Anolis carolinensis]|eukprot:XP_003216032.2 PREDICTED: spermatogenesis-associated protein 17 [Anolis carolinensis]